MARNLTRNLNYTLRASSTSEEDSTKMAQLTRHMKARLEEYFCVSTVTCDQSQGFLQVSLKGFSCGEVVEKLEKHHIFMVAEEELLCCYLSPKHKFEDIDFVWGILLGILG